MRESSKETLRLLIVGYHFMRTQAAGSHRQHAMVKYLSRMGWNVTVLTVPAEGKGDAETHHESVVKYIPAETKVIQTKYLDLNRIRSNLRGRNPVGSPIVKAGATSIGEGKSESKGGGGINLWRKPARWMRGVLNFPDPQIGWFFPLMFRSWTLLKRQRFDVVLTSGPPHSSHLPFVVLKTLFSFLWVCDFRDPWTDPPFYALNGKSLSTKPVRLFVNRRLERSVLRSCDRVLTNTTGNHDALRRTFRDQVQNKLTVLTNGFDEDLVGSRGSLDETALHCDFVFTGAMYRWMLIVYLEALKYLRGAGKQLPKLHIFGRTYPDVRQKCRDYGVEDSVVFKGRVSYEESLWVLNHARALLLLFVGHDEVYRSSVPSKLYAYISSRRPYLALVPDGDTARILEEVGGGVVIKSSEPREVAVGITSFLDSLNAGTLGVERNENALSQYSWSSLSSRLDSLLGDDLERKGRSGR